MPESLRWTPVKRPTLLRSTQPIVFRHPNVRSSGALREPTITRMRAFPPLALAIALSVCTNSPQVEPPSADPGSAAAPAYSVALACEAEWQQLNPKRGDKSPKAATLWGDRDGPGPSGFLLRPVDGFSSPPHIHTAYYHGVVITGTIHNAEPSAEERFLPTGSFWTQPIGGVHITACRGDCLAYIEMEGGYDVLPVENASDDIDEETVVDASKIAWTDPPGQPGSADGARVSVLWGDPQDDHPNGTLVELEAGFVGTMRGHGSEFHAVAIRGHHKYRNSNSSEERSLDPGGYFGSSGEALHHVSCEVGQDCILYVRSEGGIDLSSSSTEQSQ